MKKRNRYLHRVFTPVSVPCYDFTLEDGQKRERVTVIIAPIKLIEYEDGSLGVGFACSRGAFCHDPLLQVFQSWEEQS